MSCLLRSFVCAATFVATLMVGSIELLAQTSLERVATGLSSGLFLTHAPGDTERIFMLEQNSGRIRVMDIDTGSVSTFMTITGLTTGGERGLLGLAFDPNYQTNGYFYTYSSHPGGFGNHQSQVRRYTVTGDPATSNSANPSTLFSIMSFSQPFGNHNGGWIGFNPAEDNPYLYIASGDGGSGGDPQNNAQDITGNRLGKMLRIDVSGDDFTSGSANYAIPDDNPFVGVTGDDEIWSYGLRNPWRNSFDRETGDLWIADVGQNSREEIDHEPFGTPGGRNYGWRVEEGFNCFDNSNTGGNPSCGDPSLIEPVHTYAHNVGNSVTGGYVYHGSVAQYEGLYFFGDFGSNRIWTLDPYANNISASVRQRNSELPANLSSLNGISSFGEDGNGELYLTSYFNGYVYRLSTTSQDAVWNGDDSVGTPGDGTSWSDADNWTRGTTVDGGFVAKDNVIFAAGSGSPTINLASPQTIAGAEFQADYTLTGASLIVLSGNVRVNAGVVGTIDTDISAETAASLRKRGDGRLNINGVAAQTVVLAGTLGGTGSVDTIRAFDGARVSPGNSIGTLTTSDYEQQAGATLEIEVATSVADQLLVNGAADIDGNLEVDGTAYAPAVRGTVDEFVILAADSVDGTFSDASYDGTPLTVGGNEHVGDGLFVDLAYSTTEVTLTNYYALDGDANGDRNVDGADFLIWNANKFTDGNDWTTGDFNGDGTTDGADFLAWNANKFTSVIPPVPEPGSLALLMLAISGLRRLRS